jgi:hypothetical protein
LILKDFVPRVLWRVFRDMRDTTSARDLKSWAKWSPQMARVSVWHLARYGFRARLQALDLTLGHFEAGAGLNSRRSAQCGD